MVLSSVSCQFETPAGTNSAGPDNLPTGPVVDSLRQGSEAVITDVNPFKKDGKKFKIAVVQSGEYYSYVDVFRGIVEGFATLGWAKESVPLPDSEGLTMGAYLQALANSEWSEYLEFPLDLFVDFDWSDNAAQDRTFLAITQGRSSADAVISLGTFAGRLFAALPDCPVPVLADSISDPINSGIIPSYEDSGKDFLTVRGDPDRYLRQVRLFHDLVQFKRLGLIYRDTEDGRSYAALDDVRKVAAERGFEIVPELRVLDEADTDYNQDRAEALYVEALRRLAPKVDAIYLAIQGGLTVNSFPRLLEILEAYDLPSFAMEGSVFVSRGALYGVSDSEAASTGIHNAKNLVAFFRGISPRTLPMVFEHLPYIAVNLDAAKRLNYDVPIEIIASSDQIFYTPVSGANRE